MGRSSKKTHIFLLNNGRKVISSDIQELDTLNLPHPKGGVPVMFLHFEGDFYDIQSAEPSKYGSWFVDQRVSSDNKIYLASKFDARFLVLPYLELTAAQPKFSPLDQVVTASGNCHRIPLTKLCSWGMGDMCDVKDLGDDMVFFRYNEQKMLQWLQSKVAKTALVLAAQRRAHGDREQTAFVSGFDAGTTNSAASASATVDAVEETEGGTETAAVSAEDTRIAVQIMTDYLSDSTANKLLASYGFTATDMQVSKKQDTHKRKADWELEMELERETLAYAMPTASADVPTANKPAPSTAGISTVTANPSAASKNKPAVRLNAASKFNGGKPVEAKKSIASFFGGPKK